MKIRNLFEYYKEDCGWGGNRSPRELVAGAVALALSQPARECAPQVYDKGQSPFSSWMIFGFVRTDKTLWLLWHSYWDEVAVWRQRLTPEVLKDYFGKSLPEYENYDEDGCVWRNHVEGTLSDCGLTQFARGIFKSPGSHDWEPITHRTFPVFFQLASELEHDVLGYPSYPCAVVVDDHIVVYKRKK